MNLLDRLRTILKILKPGIILMIPVFLGCETSDDIGIQYDLDSNANVKFTEFTLPATNIYMDSLRTDGENSVIAGKYNDQIGGEILAEGYFTLSFLSGPLPRGDEFLENDTLQDGSIVKVLVVPEDTLELDSIKIIFEASSTISTTEMAFQEFDIFQLQDSLIREAVYLSSLEANKDYSIGRFSSPINVLEDSIYQVSLNEEFANSFFNLLSEIGRDSTRTGITETYQSLGIVPTENSNALSTFDLLSDTARLLVYSSPIDTGMSDSTYITSFRFSTKSYSYINRENSTFGSLQNGDEVTLPENKSIIDPIYGISPIVSISALIPFIEENERIIINSASMIFSISDPVDRDTLENFYSFFYRNKSFNASGLVNNPFSSLIMSDNAFLTGQNNPSVSFLNDDETELILDGTLFFQTLYNEYVSESETSDLIIRETNENQTDVSLIDFIMLSRRNISLQRSIFERDSISLRIYYTEVDQ